MIRILQLGMIDTLGGIETFLINYYRNIDKNKIQFDFINISKKDLCFQNEIFALGGRIYNVSSYYNSPLKYIREVRKIIKENNYDIIHCNMNSAVMLYPLIAAKLGGAKIIISHSHNSSSDKGKIKEILHWINKHFIPFFANRYFACSDKAGSWFYSKRIMNSNDYYVINNAVDIDKFKFNNACRISKRKQLGFNDNNIVLGHVGRFHVQKNHDFLIDIFERAYQKNKNLRLILIGIGPLFDSIKSKVNKLNLNDVVLLLGQRDDVNELMSAMDIFVLPSFYEGLPLVGVEAQVSGLKCLFSDVITDEVKLLETTEYLSLKTNLQDWVDKFLEFKHVDIDRNKVKIDAFDIKINARKLEKIYFEFSDENTEN